MPRFRDFLNEELKDPEFREGYEQVSAEEDVKLQAAMAAPDYTPSAYTAWDGTTRQWRYTDAERPLDASCYDCGRPYEFISDCVVPNDVWERIKPAESQGAGILCANCIIERLHCLNISGVEAKLW